MKMSAKGRDKTVAFRTDKETKEKLQRRLVELQAEDKMPLDASKSDIVRALAEMWVDGEVEVDPDRVR
jgi:hypothetical protein